MHHIAVQKEKLISTAYGFTLLSLWGCPMWSQAGEIFCHVADPAVPLPIDNIHQNWCSVSQISQATIVRSGVLGLFVRNASQTQMHGWCVYIIRDVSIILYVITVYVIRII